jgi:hypothetical protein
VTGKYDVLAKHNLGVDDSTILLAGGALHTDCAHIVPEATYFNVSDTPTSTPRRFTLLMLPELILAQRDYAASVLTVLKRFGYDVEKLNGPKVHSLYNVMTLDKNIHDWFDRLEVWFEKTVSVAFIPCALSN